MVSVSMSDKNSPHIFALEQGKIWQRIRFPINPHARVNHKPQPCQLNGKTTRANSASSPQKNNLHHNTSFYLLSFTTCITFVFVS